MFQAFDIETKLPALQKIFQTDSDLIEALEPLYRKRLEQTARGKAMLAAMKEIKRSHVEKLFEIKYATCVWIRMSECRMFPEQEELVNFYLKKTRRFDIPLAGVYDPNSGVFICDSNEQEYEPDQVQSFIIIPPYDSDTRSK